MADMTMTDNLTMLNSAYFENSTVSANSTANLTEYRFCMEKTTPDLRNKLQNIREISLWKKNFVWNICTLIKRGIGISLCSIKMIRYNYFNDNTSCTDIISYVMFTKLDLIKRSLLVKLMALFWTNFSISNEKCSSKMKNFPRYIHFEIKQVSYFSCNLIKF